MDESRAKIIADMIKTRQESTGENLGTERVDISHLGDLKFRVKKADFDFTVDEPSDRGGTNVGPNPLGYFLAGAASCLMMQYVRLATAKGIPIEHFEMTARGHFQRRIRGTFTDMVYDVKIQSPQDDSAIIALSKSAEDMCFVHQTLLRAGVKMTTNVSHNGKQVVTLEPSHSTVP
jgi:uncharacterized OsmC-like protein